MLTRLLTVAALLTLGGGRAGPALQPHDRPPGPPALPAPVAPHEWASPAPTDVSPPSVVSYSYPLPGPVAVLRPFVPPPTPYSAGHRGVDLRSAERGPVFAAADATVRFAGPVAGRGVVVLAHTDGVSTEYEPLDPAIRAGEAVRRGEPIGVIAGRHPGCPGPCLHWGGKRGGQYFDPLGLLRPLGPVVLLPWPRTR